MARVTKAAAKKPAAANKPVKAAPAAAPAKQTQNQTNAENNAINNPVVASNVTDTRELDVAQGAVTIFDKVGERHDEDSDIVIENNLDNAAEKAAALAFLEEKVEIIIADSSDKNAEKMVYCSVNGRGPGPGGTPYLPRGINIVIPRKYVEVLAMARDERVKNEEKVNHDNGERYIEHPRVSSLKYPFQVVRDENPKGRQWLSDLLRRRA